MRARPSVHLSISVLTHISTPYLHAMPMLELAPSDRPHNQPTWPPSSRPHADETSPADLRPSAHRIEHPGDLRPSARG
ncbi:hypothetical protein K488DRAFT_92554 [Vararia minispora EC-137]|uniref:Uncharacterized protein n=1 Tax=Vararia minispora EC-137 TaxID=1314806 RepID=A0ACB8Q3Z2_9AGAM|nr:hypothetical protein K488DRAFT_92554 [Vararia minispora EC-137]